MVRSISQNGPDMALPPSRSVASVRAQAQADRSALSQLETEILEEAASSLAHYGRAAEDAIKKLNEASDAERPDALQDAADAVWALFVQRELCGMRDHRYLIRELGISQAVLNRMGVVRKTTPGA